MKDNILYGIIGLFGGILLTWFFASFAVNNQNQGMMGMMGMNMMGQNGYHEEHHGESSMDDMMGEMHASLQNKSGDEFDKAFISEMIIHHQGAVDMAELALEDAKHQEIKDLARNIIDAQNKEINQMKEWQNAWYK
jgi:uncharacterized protein (DUF305 family)